MGPALDGRFAFPLDDGRLVMAGPGRPENRFRPAQGRISGVALVPGGRGGLGGAGRALVVATREGDANWVGLYGPP